MSLTTVLYQNLHSYNDTASPSLLKDTEARMLINAVPDRGGVSTRPGTVALNAAGLGDSVDRSIEWLVRGESRSLITTRGGKKLKRVMPDGSTVDLLDLAAADVSTFQIQNVLYIGDGADIYAGGVYDYTTESGVIASLKTGKIVQNTPAASGGGVEDHFYQATTDLVAVNLATADYSDTGKWLDVTDTPGVISSVFRKCDPYDAAAKQIVKLVINYNSSAAASVTVTLNGVSTTVAVAAGATATAVATKIRAASFATAGYVTSGSGSTVYFTAIASGAKSAPEYDAGTTMAYGAISVDTAGATNDNKFSEAVKCKIFLQHPLSKRIFATGNPDNPTCTYYSNVNDPTYFPKDGMLYPTTAEKEGITLVLLGEAILVGYTNSWWYYSGVNPKSDGVWKMLNIPYGPIGREAVAMTPFSITFASHTGIYMVNAAVLNQEILMLQNEKVVNPIAENRVENTIKSIANGSKVRTVFHDNRLMVAYSETAGADNDRVLVYDMAVDGFFQYEGWNVNDWCHRADGTLLIGSKNYLLKTGIGTSDVDVETGGKKAIRYFLKLKDYDCGKAMFIKFIQFLYLLFKQNDEATASKVSISIAADYKTTAYNNVSLSDTFKWGRPWGGIWGKLYADLQEMVGQPRLSARSFAVTIECNAIDSPVGFYGIGFAVRMLRPKGRNLSDGSELLE